MIYLNLPKLDRLPQIPVFVGLCPDKIAVNLLARKKNNFLPGCYRYLLIIKERILKPLIRHMTSPAYVLSKPKQESMNHSTHRPDIFISLV